MGGLECVCPDCGKELGSYRARRIHQAKGCANTVECRRCGDEFEVPPSRDEQRVQCSDCYQKYGFIDETIEKQAKSNRGLSRGGQPSGEQHWNWSGGETQYPLEFNSKLKSQIRRRDQYRCQECMLPQYRCTQKHDVHHIDGDKNNNRLDNLLTLCRSCHVEIEQHG